MIYLVFSCLLLCSQLNALPTLQVPFATYGPPPPHEPHVFFLEEKPSASPQSQVKIVSSTISPPAEISTEEKPVVPLIQTSYEFSLPDAPEIKQHESETDISTIIAPGEGNESPTEEAVSQSDDAQFFQTSSKYNVAENDEKQSEINSEPVESSTASQKPTASSESSQKPDVSFIQTSYEYKLPEIVSVVSVTSKPPAVPAEVYVPPVEVVVAQEPEIVPYIKTSYEYSLPETVVVNKVPENVQVVSVTTHPADVYGSPAEGYEPPVEIVIAPKPAVAPYIQTSYQYEVPEAVVVNKQPESVSIISATSTPPTGPYAPPTEVVIEPKPAVAPYIQTSYQYEVPDAVVVHKQPDGISVVSVTSAPPTGPYAPPAEVVVAAKPGEAPYIQTSYKYDVPDAVVVKEQPESVSVVSVTPAPLAGVYGPSAPVVIAPKPAVVPYIQTSYQYEVPEAVVVNKQPESISVISVTSAPPTGPYAPPAEVVIEPKPAIIPYIQTSYQYDIPHDVVVNKQHESIGVVSVTPVPPAGPYAPPADVVVEQKPAAIPYIQTSYRYEVPEAIEVNNQPEIVSVDSAPPRLPYAPPAEVVIPQKPAVVPYIQTSYQYEVADAVVGNKQPDSVSVVSVDLPPASVYGPPPGIKVPPQPAVVPYIQTSYQYNVPDAVVESKTPEGVSAVLVNPAPPAEIYGPPSEFVHPYQPPVVPYIKTSYKYNYPDAAVVDKKSEGISVISVTPAPSAQFVVPQKPVPYIQNSYQYDFTGVKGEHPEGVSVVTVTPVPPVQHYGPPAEVVVPQKPVVVPYIQSSYQYELPEVIHPQSVSVVSVTPSPPSAEYEFPAEITLPKEPSVSIVPPNSGPGFIQFPAHQPCDAPHSYPFPQSHPVYIYPRPENVEYDTAPFPSYPSYTPPHFPASQVTIVKPAHQPHGPSPPSVTFVQNGHPVPENVYQYLPPGSVIEDVVPGHLPVQEEFVFQEDSKPYPPAVTIVEEKVRKPAVAVAEEKVQPSVEEEKSYPYPAAGVPVIASRGDLPGPY